MKMLMTLAAFGILIVALPAEAKIAKGAKCDTTQCRRLQACQRSWVGYHAAHGYTPGYHGDRQTYIAGCLKKIRLDT